MTTIAKPEHEVTFQDVLTLINRHSASMSKEEVLAVASNIVGKLIALQDQRTMTVEKVMTIVSKNIEIGNAQVLDELKNLPTEGGVT